MTFIEELKLELLDLEKRGMKSAIVIKAFLDNPEQRLLVSIAKLVDKLSGEIDALSEKKASILNGEDREFERVHAIILKFREYYQALKSGREGAVNGSLPEDKPSGNWLEDMARNKGR